MEAFARHEILRKLVSGGVIEAPFVWQDKEWNTPCKMKMDYLKNTTEGIYVLDYKTTAVMDRNIRYIDTAGFQYDVGFYNRGIKAKYGQPIKKFIFIFQSTKDGEENMIRIMVVEGAQIEACEIATELAVREITPRLKAWEAANAIVCAENDPAKYKEETEKKEAAMLRAWLPNIEAQSWEVSPFLDRELAESIHKSDLIE